MFGGFFARRQQQASAIDALHKAVVRQARDPAFYETWQVPDTIDGRFDMVVLHATLVIDRLGEDGEVGRELAQALFDCAFKNFDQTLREMGHDTAVAKRIKTMARAFYGRMDAYVGDGTKPPGPETDAALAEALRRNLYAKIEPREATVTAMVGYMRREADGLRVIPLAALRAGRLVFGAPPRANATDPGIPVAGAT